MCRRVREDVVQRPGILSTALARSFTGWSNYFGAPVLTSNATPAPETAFLADTLQDNSAAAFQGKLLLVAGEAPELSRKYLLSAFVKDMASLGGLLIRLSSGDTSLFADLVVNKDCSSVVVGSVSGWVGLNPKLKDVGAGWSFVSMEVQIFASVGTGGVFIGVVPGFCVDGAFPTASVAGLGTWAVWDVNARKMGRG